MVIDAPLVKCLHSYLRIPGIESKFRGPNDRSYFWPCAAFPEYPHVPPAGALVRDRVEHFCREMQEHIANEAWTTVETAAFALWWVINVHPFRDGNGRTARALAFYILSEGGEAPALLCSDFHAMIRGRMHLFVTAVAQVDKAALLDLGFICKRRFMMNF